MAMVLDAVAPYVCKLLQEKAKEEAGMLLGAHGEIKKLEQMLGDLEAVLADAERKRITDKTVQRWVGELKDVMYDALDITDLCQIKADERHTLEEGCKPLLSFLQERCGFLLSCLEGVCTPLLFCLQDPLFAHNIATKIKKVNQKLKDIKERSATFGFIKLSSYETRRVVSLVSRNTSPEPSDVVGVKIEQDTMMLVEMLTNKSENISVVSIVGVGGIGKSTLAQRIFHDKKIQDDFMRRMWVCISPEFKEVDVLHTIITAAGGEHGGEKDKALLVPKLANTVRGKKFLLVLDDVWNADPWNKLLKNALKSGSPGSRVVVTTRNEDVAKQMKAVYYHHAKKLATEDGWLLLKEQVVSSENDIEIEQLKDIGTEIVEKCDGLALAIKTVGGLLCTKQRTKKDWLDVLQRFQVGMPEELSNALYLSYEDLPSHLKQCFLYCSLFPTDEVISRADIIPLWIAEGFVQDDVSSRQLEAEGFVTGDGSSRQLEDLATDYYKELVMRNLLEPNGETYDQGECGMHDVLRAFAHHVAKDESLVLSEGQNIHTGPDTLKFRRLSMSSKNTEWDALHNQHLLRTLLIFGGTGIKPGDISNCLFSLRVLNLCGANLTTLPDSLCHLKYLRYLDLSGTDISMIPHDIENLKLLQYISLINCKNLSQLPHGVVKLYRLRYLLLEGTSVHTVQRGFGSLKNLVNLSGFMVHVDSTANDGWCSLQELGPLSQLHELHLEGLENAASGSVASRAKLFAKLNLRCLELKCRKRIGDNGQMEEGITGEQQQKIEEVLDELCPSTNSLEELKIGGYFGRRHPKWMTARTLENLRWLKLVDSACCKQLPASLGQLPNLMVLWIKRAPSIERIGREFVSAGHGIHPSGMPAVAFRKLETLSFGGMVGWEEWDWEQQVQAMPALSTLEISNCKLRCLPPALAHHARALKELTLEDIHHLVAVDNFLSVVELDVSENPKLERIANLPNLKELTIKRCPRLKILEDVPALETINLEDCYMETLPEYLEDAKLKELEIDCSLELLKLISMKDDGPEWKKIEHIAQVNAYADEGDEEREWYVLYTKEPDSFEAYISEEEEDESDGEDSQEEEDENEPEGEDMEEEEGDAA